MTYDAGTRETQELARELKFLVPAEQGIKILAWAREALEADPHGHGEHRDGYRTTSLYFDTRGFDVYRRRGSFKRSKYRIRSYDTFDRVFLERKLRTSTLLSKRRTIVGTDTLGLIDDRSATTGWAGDWFRKRVAMRQLRPVCQVSYDRAARVGTSDGRRVRLTFDTNMVAQRANGLGFQPEQGVGVLNGQVIIEMKFAKDVPGVFKTLIETFRLERATVSKYRASMEALGAIPGVIEPAVEVAVRASRRFTFVTV